MVQKLTTRPPKTSNRKRAIILLAIAVGILDTMLWHIIGWWLSSMVSMIFNLALFAVWIYMIVTTYQGRTTVLPIIGPIAQQQAG